jgi:hypothetical protein
MKWNTINPYGDKVNAMIFTSPASDIYISKSEARVGGYDSPSSVYAPVVWFRSSTPSISYFRVTALFAKYANESARTMAELPVTGTGSAIKVTDPTGDAVDYIYTGKDTSSFAGFSTDADTAFIRFEGNVIEITLLSGSYLDYQNEQWVSLSKKADYIIIKNENGSIDYTIQGEMDLQGELLHRPIDPEKIIASSMISENQNTNPITVSFTSTNTRDTFNLISFFKSIVKQVLSFFT